MEPFPEINEFKIRQGKIGVQILELRNLFVFLKSKVPFAFIQGRQGP